MEDKEWRFCVVGNIVKQHQGEDGTVYYGTKVFPGGAKVYIADELLRLDNRTIKVLGLNRHKRYNMEWVSMDLIENVRVQRVFKPKVLNIMDNKGYLFGWAWRNRTAEDRRTLEAFVKNWEEYKAKPLSEVAKTEKKKTLWSRLFRKKS